MQNLIAWVCLSGQIKDNNNFNPQSYREYKKIEPDCREEVAGAVGAHERTLQVAETVCYESRMSLKGQKFKIENYYSDKKCAVATVSCPMIF